MDKHRKPMAQDRANAHIPVKAHALIADAA